MTSRARLKRHALRALLAALLLWVAPATPIAAATPVAVAALSVTRGAARSAAPAGVSASALKAERALSAVAVPASYTASATALESASPGALLAPSQRAPSAPRSPRYLLHCALLC